MEPSGSRHDRTDPESPWEILVRMGEILRSAGISQAEAEDALGKERLRRGLIDLPRPEDPARQASARLRDLAMGIGRSETVVLALIQLAWQLEDTFEDRENAGRWLGKPCRALNGKRPIDLLCSEDGLAEVKGVLGRIDGGVYG